MALHYLHKTAALDLDPDPNSAGGIRMAGLGGMWQTVMLGFAGVDLMGDTLGINPKLPPQWRSLSFRICWRGRIVEIRIADRTVQATLVQGEAMDIQIAGGAHRLLAGTTLQVSI
jgi:trehalose/maltose hydrolase-like predicted phosphorylase